MASILRESKNNGTLLTLESSSYIAKQLQENRDNNGFAFPIEASALSQRRLAQKEWKTIPLGPNDPIPPKHTEIRTITLEALRKKYAPAAFDTLVLDCEGAFYYILQDTPDILNGIQKILMENDYMDITHKRFIDQSLLERGFHCIHREGLKEFIKIPFPLEIKKSFFETWIKT